MHNEFGANASAGPAARGSVDDDFRTPDPSLFGRAVLINARPHGKEAAHGLTAPHGAQDARRSRRNTPIGGLMTASTARRMFDLVEPIGVIPYSADEPNETMFALGFTNYWDTYFAGRAAPLGHVPAEVV